MPPAPHPFRASFPSKLYFEIKTFRNEEGMLHNVVIEDDGWQCHADCKSDEDKALFTLKFGISN
jgi:hypothetical protein